MLNLDDVCLTNTQGVSAAGDRIVVLMPKPRMTREEALVHAAWLVAVADEDLQFPAILERIQNT